MQRQILAEASRDGTLDQLYWYVEIRLPLSWKDKINGLLKPASHPHEWVPVIPVGDDPKAAEREALKLRDEFAAANTGRGFSFSICLTAIDILESAGVQWYRLGETPWGEDAPAPIWDDVCPTCGTVTRGEPCDCGNYAMPLAAVAGDGGVWHVFEAGRVLCGAQPEHMGGFIMPERRQWTEFDLCAGCAGMASKRLSKLLGGGEVAHGEPR